MTDTEPPTPNNNNNNNNTPQVVSVFFSPPLLMRMDAANVPGTQVICKVGVACYLRGHDTHTLTWTGQGVNRREPTSFL
ncbi:hypothetical protein E2C01_100441 [Portunus trituberculatus]|uniref:Uncharacterized protein n=1 Tax=Portunus trituberculatus TaxID=210409 RepID=A0A5B7KD29_PORTR|nr:hypothetical protein [Portunus trituberculatus]